jgi:hypothetical protein
MSLSVILPGIVFGGAALLALPASRHGRGFFRGFMLSFAVVILPLIFFFLSSLLEPDWKGACHHGWLDCFIPGKLALTPLALLATAAL